MARRKIDIKKIEKKPSLQTTFTKRRGGLFKKATEFCEKFGAEGAVVVYSMAGNLFTWQHPTNKQVLTRYVRERMRREAEDKPPEEREEDAQQEVRAAAIEAARPDGDGTKLSLGKLVEELVGCKVEGNITPASLKEEVEGFREARILHEATNRDKIHEKIKEIKDWLDVVRETRGDKISCPETETGHHVPTPVDLSERGSLPTDLMPEERTTG